MPRAASNSAWLWLSLALRLGWLNLPTEIPGLKTVLFLWYFHVACFDPIPSPHPGPILKSRWLQFHALFLFLCSVLPYKLPIVPLVTLWLWFNVSKNFSIQPSWLFIRPGKNKSSTCHYSLSGGSHCGVSRPRAETWKLTNGIWFRALERNTTKWPQSRWNIPSPNYEFLFIFQWWDGKENREGNDSLQSWLLPGRGRGNFGVLSFLLSLFYFFFMFMTISMRLTEAIFRGRKIFTTLKNRSGSGGGDVRFCSKSKPTGA